MKIFVAILGLALGSPDVRKRKTTTEMPETTSVTENLTSEFPETGVILTIPPESVEVDENLPVPMPIDVVDTVDDAILKMYGAIEDLKGIQAEVKEITGPELKIGLRNARDWLNQLLSLKDELEDIQAEVKEITGPELKI